MKFGTKILEMHFKMIQASDAYDSLERTRKRDATLMALSKVDFYTTLYIHTSLDDKRPVFKILKDIGKSNAWLLKEILKRRVTRLQVKWLEAKRALMECVVQPTDQGYIEHLHNLHPERYYFTSCMISSHT
jgi:hypothetical protein